MKVTKQELKDIIKSVIEEDVSNNPKEQYAINIANAKAALDVISDYINSFNNENPNWADVGDTRYITDQLEELTTAINQMTE